MSHIVQPHTAEGDKHFGLHNALDLIEKLTKSKALNSELLKQAKAVQFLFSRKAGIVFGRSAAFGFTLAKVATNADGTAVWSAPCFLAADSFSFGATFGVQEGGSVSCMMSEAAATYIQTHGGLGSGGVESNLSVFKGIVTGASADFYKLNDVITVDFAEGLLADLSFKVGALEVDEIKNSEIYGNGVAPTDILGAGAKTVQRPKEFEVLYSKLNDIILGK